MKIPLEEYIPYRISALIVLALFYGIYLVKQWRQKRRGIRTMQIGRGKEVNRAFAESGLKEKAYTPEEIDKFSVELAETWLPMDWKNF